MRRRRGKATDAAGAPALEIHTGKSARIIGCLQQTKYA